MTQLFVVREALTGKPFGEPSAPSFLQEANEISVHDQFDILVAVTAFGQHRWQARQVGNRIEVGGRLFATESAVQVRADSRMTRVAGELTDVVDMVE